MSIYQTLSPGKLVSFDIYPSSFLGNIEHMKVDAIIDYNTAIQLGFDPSSLHVMVYPTLNSDVLNRADSYQYVKLSKPNNKSVIVGLPWIKEETIVQHQFFSATVTIENIEPGDEVLIREVLQSNGFNATAVKVW